MNGLPERAGRAGPAVAVAAGGAALGVREHRWALPAGRRASGMARRLARQALPETAGEGADDVVLAVSELVANAVTHGRPPVELRMKTVDRGDQVAVTCEVADSGAAVPVFTRRQAGLDAVSARGLQIVTSLAISAGVRLDPRGGKAVWFVIDVPFVAAAPAPPGGMNAPFLACQGSMAARRACRPSPRDRMSQPRRPLAPVQGHHADPQGG
jgi:anti-sigma regulatory factor (Ser/Thr protein kinase)